MTFVHDVVLKVLEVGGDNFVIVVVGAVLHDDWCFAEDEGVVQVNEDECIKLCGRSDS